VAPAGGAQYTPPKTDTQQQLLAVFDQGVARARAAIESVTDQQMMQSWSLLNAGKPLFTMPRAAVIRSFVMNHVIHHRAQLGVYLRLNDIPVPSMYGPSADENTF